MIVLARRPSSTAQRTWRRGRHQGDPTMGAYRALAQLYFQAFQKGDILAAAELARNLERTWDGAEEGGGPRSL